MTIFQYNMKSGWVRPNYITNKFRLKLVLKHDFFENRSKIPLRFLLKHLDDVTIYFNSNFNHYSKLQSEIANKNLFGKFSYKSFFLKLTRMPIMACFLF